MTGLPCLLKIGVLLNYEGQVMGNRSVNAMSGQVPVHLVSVSVVREIHSTLLCRFDYLHVHERMISYIQQSHVQTLFHHIFIATNILMLAQELLNLPTWQLLLS